MKVMQKPKLWLMMMNYKDIVSSFRETKTKLNIIFTFRTTLLFTRYYLWIIWMLNFDLLQSAIIAILFYVLQELQVCYSKVSQKRRQSKSGAGRYWNIAR